MDIDLEDVELRPRPVPVRVAALTCRKTSEPLEAEGRFAASRAVLLKSPSSGFLEGRSLALGDLVTEGEILGTVGEKMARQRAIAAEAAEHAAEAALAERDDHLVAAQARGEPADRLALFEAKRKAVEHKLHHERAQRRRHDLMLDALHVVAPFDARVAAVHLSPGASVMSGNPLIELVDVDPIVLVVEVPTFAARRCPVGTEVEVRSLADPTPRKGRVSRWSPTAADDVRRLLIDVDNADGMLAAGERGVALLDVGERDAFYAPRVALMHEKKLTHLQLVEHNRVQLRRVRTFGGDDREVEVAGRLEASQLVVLHAERPLKDETEVTIQGDH